MSDDPQPPGGDDNRRRHPRTTLSLLVQFRFNTFEDFLAEYSVNISPGGMFIRTTEPREEGSMIYLQFSLKDGSKLIEGMGRVVRVNPPNDPNKVAGMGIEFVNFDEESMELIQEICSTRGAARN
jgi:molecular chaperone DnaK